MLFKNIFLTVAYVFGIQYLKPKEFWILLPSLRNISKSIYWKFFRSFVLCGTKIQPFVLSVPMRNIVFHLPYVFKRY